MRKKFQDFKHKSAEERNKLVGKLQVSKAELRTVLQQLKEVFFSWYLLLNSV